MRQGLLVILAILGITLESLGQASKGNILLLVRQGSSVVKAIQQGDHIWFKTNPADRYKEVTISMISGDTLSFPGDKIRISQIVGFETYQFDNIKKYDLTEWRFIVPPKEVCTSYEMTLAFGAWIAKKSAPDSFYDYTAWLNSAKYKSAIQWSAKRIILFESKDKPTLFRIAEKQRRELWFPGEKQVKFSMINRIRGDSVYLDGTGFKFHQIDSIVLSFPVKGPFSPIRYYRSGSAFWEVFFPPDSIYWSRTTYGDYWKEMSKKRRKDHFEWRSPVFRHNMIKLNISRIANMEEAISYEYRFTKEWSLEIEGGYQWQVGSAQNHDLPLDLYPLYKYTGFSLYTGPKYYFNSRGYVQFLLQYRYLEMDSAMSRFPYAQYLLQDEFRNDYGSSVRIGQLIRFGGMIVDGYFGLGIKAVLVRQYAYGYYYSMGESDLYFHWYNDQHTPTINDITQWWPVIGFGIKVGFGF
jgi:hypothetical protein